ncbi:MAG: rhodanese-like domain-containing protein [Dongiaceae bacterium]
MAYAGDLRPTEAWELLRSEPGAQLIDVRTAAEWSFVGVPDLHVLNKRTALISWQVYPTMQVNDRFADEVARLVPETKTPILFICRSGGRSAAAAAALTARGFQRCYNIAGGFEGGHDASGHRGSAGGWKADGLPWTQE